MTGCVYFIQEVGGGPIKIGFTTGELRQRWLAIQSGNPRELQCLGYVPKCVLADELEWLSRFNDFRIRGEWFWPHASLLAAIGAVAQPMNMVGFFHRMRHAAPPAWIELERWIQVNGHNHVSFAKLIGCSQPHFSARVRGRKRTTAALAKRISLATGGVIPAQGLIVEANTSEQHTALRGVVS